LAKENPKKFYALCEDEKENLKNIEPLLDEKMKQIIQKQTVKESKLPRYS
jgi:hypothetical protein